MTDRMTNAEIEALCHRVQRLIPYADEEGFEWALKECLAAIRQLQQQWQGIESAPKVEDCGTNFLLLTHTNSEDYHSNITVGFWGQTAFDGETVGWCDWAAGLDDLHDNWHEVHPTHWMPLPHAPEPGQ